MNTSIGRGAEALPVADEARRKRSEQQVMQAAAKQGDDCELDRASEAQRDRWFESNCHHHSQALVDQGLASFLPYSHVRDLSLLTACSTNEAMRRWHGFVAWRYGFFARKSHGSVAVLEGERSDSFLILHWNQRIINCIKSANMIQPYARRP